jgi:large subunit ribosomal protein L10
MLAKVMFLIQAPAQRLAAAINAVGRNVAAALDQAVQENKFTA